MKSLTIKGTKRVGLTKQELKKLRADGKVPCVLYGGKENVHFSTTALELRDLVYSPNVYTVNLELDGQHHQATMKDIQFHPVTDKIQHIDFLELDANKPVALAVPVHIKGSAEGVKQGGKLIQKMRKMNIKALPAHLPDAIEIDVTPLGIGQAVKVGMVQRENITLLDSPNNIIVAIRTTRNVVEENPAAAAAAAPAAAAKPAAAPAAKAAK
jgi:large subunit ribosomal protein L25